jgi:hypothetical protein
MTESRPDNSFIFCYVRMNPPTPGHLQLVKEMINKAIEIGARKLYIITSSSMDGKNPLPCSDSTIPKPKSKKDGTTMGELLSQGDLVYKSSILEEMIHNFKRHLIEAELPEGAAMLLESVPISIEETPAIENSSVVVPDPKRSKPEEGGYSKKKFGGNRRQQIADLEIIILCSTGNPFAFIHGVIQKDFLEKGIPKINMFFIVGRDRADFLDTVVEMFKSRDYISSIDGNILERDGMAELKAGLCGKSVSEINPCSYSASFIRGLVAKGNHDEFQQIYTPYLSPENIHKLYETIQKGITMSIPKSKEDDENPRSEWFDVGEAEVKRLPWISPSEGGKRKRTRKYKKSKKKSRKRF